jgi:hypothetical protein
MCGLFTLTGTAATLVPIHLGEDVHLRAVFSHAIRKLQTKDKRPTIDWNLAKRIIETRELPSPFEQADNLILWLGESIKVPGETEYVVPATHQAIIGAGSALGVKFVLDHLFDTGLVTGTKFDTLNEKGRAHVTLSFSGWERYNELKRGRSDSKKAFMAMQYGDALLDRVVKDFFKPAIARTGFSLVRLDDAPSAGLIDDRLRVEILTSRFLVVDLTHGNRGAYWEAGYAEGLGKPVIYTCEKAAFSNGKSHFDTNHHLTVIWDQNDLDAAARVMQATIRATLPDEAILSD